MMNTLRPGSGAVRYAWGQTSSRIVSMWMSRPSGSTTNSFGWCSRSARVQSRHSPQPPLGQSRAATNARATKDLPDPSGPASTYAWCGRSAARRRNATAASCPATSSRTAAMRGRVPPGDDSAVAVLVAFAKGLVDRRADVVEHLGGIARGVDHDEPLGVLLRDPEIGVRDRRQEGAALLL